MSSAKKVKPSVIAWQLGCVLCLLLSLFLAWQLSRGYGEISESAYHYARSLYTVCNQRDVQRLERIISLFEADLRSQKINARDHRYLMGLAEKARLGEWDDAQNGIRKLLEAQMTLKVD